MHYNLTSQRIDQDIVLRQQYNMCNPQYVNSLTVVGQCFSCWSIHWPLLLRFPIRPLINLLASKFKILGTVLSWIRSYQGVGPWSDLSDRSYRVKTDSDLSELRSSNVGVPQGSFVGPILSYPHTTTETAEKVVIVRTHYNFFRNCNDFFQQLYIWTKIFTKI